MTKLNNDINDFEISDGKNHVLYFTDDKLKLRTIDIDVQPIIDAIETTIHNMADAKQLENVDYIEKIIGIGIGDLK
jgi:hypothetical protein|tara:strand:- start:3406 stop:3633 length:228 start_codon:yes stop_codon:yes gene_type:complete